MSDTSSFVDPVFLARFGLARMNVLDYFLHPLNPFRTKNTTSNEILMMQGISIGMLIQYGIHNQQQQQLQNQQQFNFEPLTPIQAEEEYNNALKRLNGEQYQLLPPTLPKVIDNTTTTTQPGTTTSANATTNTTTVPTTVASLNQLYLQPAPLYVIRHVIRTSTTKFKIIGIYYIVEGIIYKSPSVRSVCKTHVTRTIHGLHTANQALSVCARYLPSTGYTWVFEDALVVPDSNSSNNKTTDTAAGGTTPSNCYDDSDSVTSYETDTSEDDDHDDNNDNHDASDQKTIDPTKIKRKKRDTHHQHSSSTTRTTSYGMDPVQLYRLVKKRKRRKILDHRRPGERTAAEEEGIRASEAIDQILVRISKSPAIVNR